jgi:hypothetical protein
MSSRVEMSAVPVRYARGNIMWGSEGSTAAMYRLPTVSYGLRPDTEKWAWLGTLAGLALTVEADLSIWRVYRRYPADEYVEQTVGLVDPRYGDAEAWRRMLESHEARLSQLASFVPEVYLRVLLPPPSITGGDEWRRAFYEAYRRVSDTYGVPPGAPVMQRDIERTQALERITFDRVQRYLPDAARVTRQEFQWLCRRCATRHVAEPDLDQNWRPNALAIHKDGEGLAFEPRASDFLRLYDAATRRDLRAMTVAGEEAVTHQAFLTLGALPIDIEFPGPQAELLFRPMDAVDFPVDAVAHFTWIANKAALSQVDKAIIDAKNAIDEATAAGHEPDERKMIAPVLARQLKKILMSEGRPPMLDAQISYAIGAPVTDDFEELERRVDAFADQFPGLKVHRPRGLQETLFHTHLPSPRGAIVPDYHETMIVDRFGMLMPLASREVGNAEGPYFMHTIVGGRPRGPAKLDLTAPARDSLPTTINMSGRQGSGKTNAALYAAYQAVNGGSRAITIDPGHDHFLVNVPSLAGKTKIITLAANEACRGMLDPLVVIDPDMRHEIAMSYYLAVLHGDRSSESLWEQELSTAVAAVIDSADGSLAVIEVLEAREGSPVAQDLARRLRTFSANGLGILAFGDGTTVQGLDDIKQVTTIRTAGLALPSPNTPRESYDRRERIAAETFGLVAWYVLRLVTQDRAQHKVVVLDEASAIPQWLLDLLARRGRKNNTSVIFCSQTVLDVTPTLRELIGMWFLFGTNSPEESARGLTNMRMDPDNKVLCDRLADPKQFEKGHGIHRDMDGRIAEIQVDIVEPDVKHALDTRPQKQKRAA